MKTIDMSEPVELDARIPGQSDRAVRRYRMFRFDFDSSAMILETAPNEGWSREAIDNWEVSKAHLLARLKATYGEVDFERKVKDFMDLGVKPFSIIAHHNQLFDQVRLSFIVGAYYSTLTSACALGERILNHLILDLRDHYKSSPHYRRIYRKESFDHWDLAIGVLTDWNVLLPNAKAAFLSLKDLRHRSIHFNQETVVRLREHSLNGVKLISTIIDEQFAAFGRHPWFIEGTPGAAFIKREWENDPFVAKYYLEGNQFVGPFHTIDRASDGSFFFVDHPDYQPLGLEQLSDSEFADRFNNVTDELRPTR